MKIKQSSASRCWQGLGRFCAGLAVVAFAAFHPTHAQAADATTAVEPQLTTVGSLSTAIRPVGVPDDYVITPNGYFAADCVKTIHPGEQMLANGMLRLANGAQQKLFACTQPNFTLDGVRVDPNGRRTPMAGMSMIHKPDISGYVETSNYVSNTPIGRLDASWIVPAQPSNRGNQVIYMFPGLEQLPTVKSILQPVLGWNGYNDHVWTLASWNCCVDGTTFHSNPIAAKAGDQVVGHMYSNCGAGVACSSWNIDSTNQTTGQNTRLTTNPYADLTWVFGGALEVYGVSACNQFPASGTVQYTNIAVYNRNFQLINSPPWNADHNTSGLSPQCGYNVTVSATTATLYY